MQDLNMLLASSYGIAVLVDVSAPILLALFLARRYGARWRFWFYGVLVFLVFQVVTRIPVMLYIQSRPGFVEKMLCPEFFWMFLLVAAFTAGLFEEGGRWIAVRFLVPREERRWRTAMMLGVGHGGLEAIGVGLLQFGALAGYLALIYASPETLKGMGQQVELARQQYASLQGWEPLLGGWERVCALVIQAAFTVMVVRAFTHGARWWWYALAAHTAVDFVAVAGLHLMGRLWQGTGAMVAVEGMVTILALLALWFILWTRSTEQSPVDQPPDS